MFHSRILLLLPHLLLLLATGATSAPMPEAICPSCPNAAQPSTASNLPTSNPRPTASDGTIPEQAECMVIGAVGLMNGGSSAPGDLAEKGGFLSVDYWSSPASFD
ncbi:hypothetical protein CF336_g8640 [Tilletia laevis]|uniref:Uncharacterized protein n=1 Tax=Tilletia caries TaxID=13290 RepID=A0A8T8T346_9BASI|nr:hypothetical protein CF336_g8640 [Tilletia laevis]KAE8253857.1 hypothetical protein A4X03_0g5797 [Tilletia caries]